VGEDRSEDPVARVLAQFAQETGRGVGSRGEFERIKGRPAEALDCLVYAYAARAGLPAVNFEARALAVATAPDAERPAGAPSRTIRSEFVGRFRR